MVFQYKQNNLKMKEKFPLIGIVEIQFLKKQSNGHSSGEIRHVKHYALLMVTNFFSPRVVYLKKKLNERNVKVGRKEGGWESSV